MEQQFLSSFEPKMYLKGHKDSYIKEKHGDETEWHAANINEEKPLLQNKHLLEQCFNLLSSFMKITWEDLGLQCCTTPQELVMQSIFSSLKKVEIVHKESLYEEKC